MYSGSYLDNYCLFCSGYYTGKCYTHGLSISYLARTLLIFSDAKKKQSFLLVFFQDLLYGLYLLLLICISICFLSSCCLSLMYFIYFLVSFINKTVFNLLKNLCDYFNLKLIITPPGKLLFF